VVAAGLLVLIGAPSACAGPLQPVALRWQGKALHSSTRALHDGKEVFVPLDAARGMKLLVTVSRKEDSADVLSPSGARTEVALTRLHGALMLPLSGVEDLLDSASTVRDGVCEIAPKERAGQARGTPENRTSTQRPVGIDGAPVSAGADLGHGAGSESGSCAGPAGDRSAPPPRGKVQKPDELDAEDQPARGEGRASPGARGPDLPSRGSVSRPTTPVAARIRDVVCEAVDPAQAKLRIVADGKLAPKVTMLKGVSEVAVDIPGTILETSVTDWSFDHPLIAGVKAVAGAAPGITRLLVKLSRLVTYRARQAPPDGYEIAFRLPHLTGRRLGEMTVVIDPGHGGPSATGCSALQGRTRIVEKALTLRIGRKVHEKLSALGLNAILTRTDDSAVSLSARPELANNNLADLFVSIHVDDAPSNANASGTTAYYHGADENSRALAFVVAQAVSSGGGVPNRGARSDMERFVTGMAVLRKAEMPAILVEVAFISNAADRAKLVTEEFHSRVADAIANGICSYVRARLPEAPPLPGPEG
jgi:N-acetylmuramoyl-L-alanine amidase